MTVFVMFFIELLASRFDIFGRPDVEQADPAVDLIRKNTIEYSDNSSEMAEKRGKHFLI